MKGYIDVTVVRVKQSVLDKLNRQQKFGGFAPEPFAESDMEQRPLDLRADTIYSIMPPSEGLTPPGVGCLVCVPMGEYMLAETRATVRKLIAAAETDG